MNLTEETLRKAINLADGLDLTEGQLTLPSGHYFDVSSCWSGGDELRQFKQWMVDALAAQLVRQVDALDKVTIKSDHDRHAIIWDDNKHGGNRIKRWGHQDRAADRSENTINAIVNSGVLEVIDAN